MTQKELLYLEDAFCHEKTIIEFLQDAKEKLQEEELQDYVEGEINIHQEIQDNIINTMEEIANE